MARPHKSPAEAIIDRCGGARALAKALKKPPSTVQSWKDSGFIPAKHQEAVIEAAARLEKPISPADFFPGAA